MGPWAWDFLNKQCVLLGIPWHCVYGLSLSVQTARAWRRRHTSPLLLERELEADTVLQDGLLEQTRRDTLCQWDTPPTPPEDSSHQIQAHLCLPHLSCRAGERVSLGTGKLGPDSRLGWNHLVEHLCRHRT